MVLLLDCNWIRCGLPVVSLVQVLFVYGLCWSWSSPAQQSSDLFARHDINRSSNGYPNWPIVKVSFLYTPEDISNVWEIILSQLYLREVFGVHAFLIVHVLSFRVFRVATPCRLRRIWSIWNATGKKLSCYQKQVTENRVGQRSCLGYAYLSRVAAW